MSAIDSDALTTIRLGGTDIAGAVLRSEAAGWNQVAADWKLFIDCGNAIGVRNASGQLIATAAAVPYGDGVGWISMVLVAQEYRHRGLATQLMQDCVRSLLDAGLTPVLDATPAGKPVYERLGFRGGFAFDRWYCEAGGDAEAHAEQTEKRPQVGIFETIAELDVAVTGIGRRFVIESFLSRPGSRSWLASDHQGFVITREGHRAAQIGPLIAIDDAQAISLLDAALKPLLTANCASVARAAGTPIFVDVPSHRSVLLEYLQRRGFSKQRSFLRMALGKPTILQCPTALYALAGPEFG